MKRDTAWRLALALACGLAGTAAGGEISLEQAETAVAHWAARGGGGWGEVRAAVTGSTHEDPETGVRMHVVRVPGKGFAVTPADDGIEPILLFSCEEGVFRAEAGDPVWDLLRRDLSMREAALAEGGREAAAKNPRRVTPAREKWAELLGEDAGKTPRGSGAGVESIWSARRRPLVKTRWNQTEGTRGGRYNLFTPGNEDGHYPAGCTAVAGGQVMRYWAHPKTAEAKTVECQVDGKKRRLEFFGSQVVDGKRTGDYQWGEMGDAEPTSVRESEFTSRLLSDLGVACGAKYRATETLMSMSTMAEQLRGTFGYAGAAYLTGNLSANDVMAAVVPNLDAGAPVVMGIGNAHAVVADGYGFDKGNTFYLHVNLGWGQAVHCWYAPPFIDSHTTIDEILCNVFPDFSGVLLSGRVTGPHGRPVHKMTVRRSGASAGETETGANGIYAFRLAPGAYQIQARDGQGSTAVQGATLPAMAREANGNRIANFQATWVKTVPNVTMSTATAKGAAGISAPILAKLSCAQQGAEIHYTLDGGEPTVDDPLYSGPIAIQDTTTLRAVAFAEGMECSETLEQTWTYRDPKSRDLFADARVLAGGSGRASFRNVGYTKEKGEPAHSTGSPYDGGGSAWATWVAPHDGDWTFWLSGTTGAGEELDTLLAVYTGDELNKTMKRIAENDDADEGIFDCSSRVSFTAEAGVAYRIAMDTKFAWYDAEEGTADYTGDLSLRWSEGSVPYLRLSQGTLFLSASGGRTRIGVESSADWSVTEHAGWIAPTALTGTNGGKLVFDAPANATGAERSGDVTLRAADGPSQTLAVHQHPMDFATTKKEALEAARRENKRILLVWGRETCANTRATLFSSIPSDAASPPIDKGYVLWYSNCDRQEDAEDYALWDILPTVAVLDPLDMSGAVLATNGRLSSGALRKFLDSAPAWGGFPKVEKATVWRFYSKNYKGHFFTISEAEKDDLIKTNPNWTFEGGAYQAYTGEAEGTTALYRFYSKSYRGHFFTIDEAEMKTVRETNPNWKYEGIAYHVYAKEVEGTVPVYRFWSKGYRHHFYTTSEAERDGLIRGNPNWAYEGISFWALPMPGGEKAKAGVGKGAESEGLERLAGEVRGARGAKARAGRPRSGATGGGMAVTTSDGSDGSAAVDGDEATGWTPTAEGAAWVALSFEEPVSAEKVEVVGENLPEGMRVLLSEDAETWDEERRGPTRYVWVALPEGESEETAVVKEISVLSE